MVVEVRDENVSMRVDSHVVRPRQLGGRPASTTKLGLGFPLRSEDKHRAALSSQKSQHGKCPAVPQSELNLVVDNDDVSSGSCCQPFWSEHLSCSKSALELAVQIKERNTFVVVIRDCNLALLGGVRSGQVKYIEPVRSGQASRLSYFGYNDPYGSLELAREPPPDSPPGYEDPGAAEHLKNLQF